MEDVRKDVPNGRDDADIRKVLTSSGKRNGNSKREYRWRDDSGKSIDSGDRRNVCRKKGNEFVKLLDDTQKGIKGGIKWLGAHTVAKTAATAAENASTAATTANTAATAAGTAATTANTAATGAATAAQGAFNAVLSANPIALVVLGIAATTTAVAALSSGLREAKEETSELAKEADKNIEKLKETSNALEETTNSAKDSVQTVEAQKKVADELITKLYSLESQTGKQRVKSHR